MMVLVTGERARTRSRIRRLSRPSLPGKAQVGDHAVVGVPFEMMAGFNVISRAAHLEGPVRDVPARPPDRNSVRQGDKGDERG